MADPRPLSELVALVEREHLALTLLPARIAGSHADWREARARREGAEAASASRLAAAGAAIRQDFAGCAIRLGGIRSTCTAGYAGALTNWLAAARRKLESGEPR